ncbi:unnamed protein product, partial [Echinostoma caproni]|uniref:Non-structural maintenance of chromosomes element 4 n=1 Tax=Echinostoma caproni TaxID=27848 RepID=A0A183AVS2_9TREM
MVCMMTSDAHSCLIKYKEVIQEEQENCQTILNERQIQQLEDAIIRRLKSVKGKLVFSRKLHKLDDHVLIDENENWVLNLSTRVIAQDEKRILNKGLNFNVRNPTNKEYLVELEQTLKSSTIPEDEKQTIRQIVVPALMRKGKPNWRALRLVALHLHALRHIVGIFTFSLTIMRHRYSRNDIICFKRATACFDGLA